MSQDNTERYILELAGQDTGALQLLNDTQEALAQTTDETDQLNARTVALTANYDSLEDAFRGIFGQPLEDMTSMVDETEQLTSKNEELARSYDQVTDSAGSAQSVIRDIGIQSSAELPEPGLDAFGIDDKGDDDGGGFSTGGLRGSLRAGARLAGGAGGDALRVWVRLWH